MPRLHPNLILGLLALTFGLVLVLVWAPLDSENGVVFTRRGKHSIGDGLAPLVAGVFFLVPGLMLILGAKPENAPGVSRRDWRVLVALLVLGAASLIIMRYAGPLAAAGQEGGYRVLRSTPPWSYFGFVLGGTVFVSGAIALVEGRLSAKALLIGFGAALAIALMYDLPFEDLQLPPNADV